MSKYEKFFHIEDVVSKCDCCERECDPNEGNNFISTKSGFGFVLCSYCILMLKHRLTDFHNDEEN